MRDEAFFRSVRVGTGNRTVLESESLLWQHHAAFSAEPDELAALVRAAKIPTPFVASGPRSRGGMPSKASGEGRCSESRR